MMDCPSHYDASGITVLEALAAGAPVAAARVGAIPEVAGEAVSYFDPARDTAIAAAVAEALTDAKDTAARRIHEGHQCTREFTWDAAAWKLLGALGKTAA